MIQHCGNYQIGQPWQPVESHFLDVWWHHLSNFPSLEQALWTEIKKHKKHKQPVLWLKSLTIYCNLMSPVLWMSPDYYVDWFVIRFNDWPTLVNTDSGIKATVQWVFICFYQPIASDTVKTVLLVLQNQYVGIATDPCWVKTTLDSVGQVDLWGKTECPPPWTLFGVDVMSGRRWSLSLDIMQDFQIFETLLRLVLLAANQLRFGEQIYSQFFFFLFFCGRNLFLVHW